MGHTYELEKDFETALKYYTKVKTKFVFKLYVYTFLCLLKLYQFLNVGIKLDKYCCTICFYDQNYFKSNSIVVCLKNSLKNKKNLYYYINNW